MITLSFSLHTSCEYVQVNISSPGLDKLRREQVCVFVCGGEWDTGSCQTSVCVTMVAGLCRVLPLLIASPISFKVWAVL